MKHNVIYDGAGERIDKALSALFPDITRSFAQKMIERGEVSVSGKTVSKNYTVKNGEEICFNIPEPEPDKAEPENIPLDIFYEDSDLLVVNKAKGMVVHPAAGNPSGTLVNALLYYCGDTLSGINGVLRPGIVHRLDKDTSGLIIVAKNDKTHKILADLIKEHDFTRQYEAIVVGHFKQPEGVIDAPIARHPNDRKKMAVIAGGRNAVTRYETIAEYPGYTHVRLTLETGRTHQIRVHMAYLGHPVVCDEVYSRAKPQFSCCKGQCLHARRIAFVHPTSGEMIDLTSDLPDYFTDILNRLDRSLA
ncbi:MAG: RluA family pseudouridine synthase [Clostridia bacterium]|nr:RluA family pseudouridine synthase [Oscillospiraceae bacterium]MBQ6796394.1 RluA family pseudouridine synthase [Clostridia bacterium]